MIDTYTISVECCHGGSYARRALTPEQVRAVQRIADAINLAAAEGTDCPRMWITKVQEAA